MRLMSNRAVEGRSWFVLGEKTQQQKQEEAMNAKMQELEKAMTALLTGKED